MTIEFITGLLIGILVGAFIALSYSGMFFVLLAKVVIAAFSYKFDREDSRQAGRPVKREPPAKEPPAAGNDHA